MDKPEPVSGTALLAWAALAKSNDEREHLRRSALELATNAGTNKWPRITALQVCAQAGYTESLATARALATDSATDPSLRLSAIAAVGQLGDQEDLTYLTEATSWVDYRRLKPAITQALQTLQPLANGSFWLLVFFVRHAESHRHRQSEYHRHAKRGDLLHRSKQE